MPGAQVSPTRVDRDQARIGVGHAALAWLTAWVAGNLVASVIIGASGYDTAAEAPVWVTVASAVALWTPMLIALWVLSDRLGSQRLADDYRLRVKPLDLIGVPVGVLSQLVVVRLVYWPVQHGWPNTFNRSRVERNARDLYEQAHGGWLVALVAVVVVGAPVVEELVYRGLLQGALTRRLNDAVAVVVVAAFFALIHFRWVEFPGLFAFGLILGVCALRTGRLGMGIVAHMAFNATGLLLVART